MTTDSNVKSIPDDEFFDDEDNFEPCDRCVTPDSCGDFGCAIMCGFGEDVKKDRRELGIADNDDF